jgi:hypothetical protein
MPRLVGRELPARKPRTEWPITDRYAIALAEVPHDGDWYEIATFTNDKYAYEVAASLRGKPMRAGKRPFPVAEGTKRSDWEFEGSVLRAKKKGGGTGDVIGGAVYARWKGRR